MFDASRPHSSSPRAGPGCASQGACSPDRASSRGWPEGVATPVRSRRRRPWVQGTASVPARVGPGRMECRSGRADGCQGVKGEWRTMTLRAGVQGSAEQRPVPAGGPWRVREGSASPERRVSDAGVRGRQPPANGSPSQRPKDDCAGYLVSRQGGAKLAHRSWIRLSDGLRHWSMLPLYRR